MNTQPEALRLAAECDDGMVDFAEAAAELRRLHALNAELLEALKEVMRVWFGETRSTSEDWGAAQKARAAIARAEGTCKATGE